MGELKWIDSSAYSERVMPHNLLAGTLVEIHRRRRLASEADTYS